MAGQDPVGDHHTRPEDNEQRLAALRIRLQETAREIRTAEDWSRCLRAAARLPGESWANILLIASRIPDATMVKRYEAWRAAGRQVNRNEKGIEIFSTAHRTEGNRRDPEDDKQSRSWRDASRVAYVWDLSQTTGQPLPAQITTLTPSGEIPPGLWDCLCWLARREGFAIEREPGCPDDGTTLWTARRIRVLPDLSGSQAIWALAHQVGHVLLHDTTAAQPGVTITGCQGVRKAEADSVAFVICARHVVQIEPGFSSPQTWAGSDPRAQPGAAILAAGEHITTATTKIIRYLDDHLPGRTVTSPVPVQATAASTMVAVASVPRPESDARIESILLDAEQFYTGQLAASWVPAYLRRRGLTPAVMGEWRIGYAPRGWTVITDYLHDRGHPDNAIQAAGLARVSSRGTLIDHFRDRVMLPVHDEHGTLAGFIGRARPGTGPDVPKYLNSPATSTYRKGDLLFGLYHARHHLARGASPVIVEGPFDALAVTVADRGRYVGLAPCGTSLTTRQAEALAHAADLSRTSVLVAFDDDEAGRKAAVRAFHILRAVSYRLQSVALPGKDPAEILETQGADTLQSILYGRVLPLSAVVIDAYIHPWEARLRDTEGPLLAMRNVAAVIADLLPPETAEAIRQIAGYKQLSTIDERMHPVANPELPQIARALPADTAYQITRTAERLGFTDYSDVLAEVANAVIRQATRPKGLYDAAPQLAVCCFPDPPVTTRADAESAAAGPSRLGDRPTQARTKRLPSL
jgi:DNA primase